MSAQALAFALGANAGSAAAQLLLVLMADAADDEHVVIFGPDELAQRAHLERRQLTLELAELIDLGLISGLADASDGHWRFKIRAPAILSSAPGDACRVAAGVRRTRQRAAH